MSSSARISTPVYLYPAHGPHCGSCRNCEIEHPYNPLGFGHCTGKDHMVNIRRKTTCREYRPRK